MTTGATMSRSRARLATTAADHARVRALRAAAFRGGADDADGHDPRCRHLLVDRDGGAVATARIAIYATGREIAGSYAALRYDLGPLSRRPGPMIEIGRVCAAPGPLDPDTIRALWGGVARIALAEGAGFLFGCTSFPGADPAPHRRALAWLARNAVAPADWAPGRMSPDAVPLDDGRTDPHPAGVPPLLRSYIAMGGRVSDHAVPDPELGTLHVFTGVDVTGIPPARRKSLLALA